MDKIKVLHFADLHLGSDFSGLGRKAQTRREDLRETFMDIIGLCKSEEVDMLLCAGDLFEGWGISEQYYQLAAEGFRGIPNTRVIITPGNHDPLSTDSAYLRENFWSGNVTFMQATFGSVVIDELKAEVWGASFTAPYAYQSLFGKVEPKQAEYIQIGVIHATVGSVGTVSEYNPVSVSQIEASGLDYLALGHIHKPSGLLKAGKTIYAYPGCPEGRGFDELGKRGVLLGEIGKGHVSMQAVPTAKRVYSDVRVDITLAENTRVASRLVIDKLLAEYGEEYENNLYKIYLKGKVPESFSIESLKTFLSEIFYVKLRDRTEIDIDLYSTAKEISLKGIFVRKMLEKLDSEGTLVTQEALKLGLKAFSGKVEYRED